MGTAEDGTTWHSEERAFYIVVGLLLYLLFVGGGGVGRVQGSCYGKPGHIMWSRA